MFQLKVLAGNKAGMLWAPRRFPVRIGRARDADLRLEDEGVWERHLEIGIRPLEGLILCVQPDVYATLNHEPVQNAVLRSGDLIEFGAVKLQFALGPTRYRGLRLRELTTWIVLALLCLVQVALIYWLPG